MNADDEWISSKEENETNTNNFSTHEDNDDAGTAVSIFPLTDPGRVTESLKREKK